MKNWIVFGCWFIGVTISFAQKNEETNSIAQSLTLEEFSKVAFDAYVYGLPLIEMEISKNKMTHPQYDGDKEWAPFGSFYHIRNFADPSQTRLRAPNVDVLYSGAWINLEQEPMVLFVPDAHDRYYSIQINDMYSNISGYIGRRTTGTKSGFYLLIAPTIPRKVTKILMV